VIARLLLAVLLAFALPAQAGEAPANAVQPTLRDDHDVLEASEKWLAILDAGKFGDAYDLGAPSLRKVVTRSKWIKGIGDARKPFGKAQSRSREKFARTHALPGLPDGDYAIVEFKTTFSSGKRAAEQLTWQYDADGKIWRVAGYYIR
jgi:hypothetical protein